MKIYEVYYSGSCLGGAAIVTANSEEEAKELVKNHPRTINFTDVEVYENEIDTNPTVLYNDNGEY